MSRQTAWCARWPYAPGVPRLVRSAVLNLSLIERRRGVYRRLPAIVRYINQHLGGRART